MDNAISLNCNAGFESSESNNSNQLIDGQNFLSLLGKSPEKEPVDVDIQNQKPSLDIKAMASSFHVDLTYSKHLKTKTLLLSGQEVSVNLSAFPCYQLAYSSHAEVNPKNRGSTTAAQHIHPTEQKNMFQSDLVSSERGSISAKDRFYFAFETSSCETMLSDVEENFKANKAALDKQQIDKVKISLLGEQGKTMVIRDYFGTSVLAMLRSSAKIVQKIIFNGKEL